MSALFSTVHHVYLINWSITPGAMRALATLFPNIAHIQSSKQCEYYDYEHGFLDAVTHFKSLSLSELSFEGCVIRSHSKAVLVFLRTFLLPCLLLKENELSFEGCVIQRLCHLKSFEGSASVPQDNLAALFAAKREGRDFALKFCNARDLCTPLDVLSMSWSAMVMGMEGSTVELINSGNC